MPHTHVQRLSTDAVPQGERFDYWSAILSRSLTPMSVDSDFPASFAASISLAPMGALTVIEQDGSAHRSHRSPRDLARSEEHSYHLLVSLASAWRLEHRGRLRLRQGDLVLTDSRHEHRIELRTAYHFMHLKMSPHWLRTWVPDADLLVGRTISRDSDAGRALSAFVSDIRPESADTAVVDARMMSDHVGALLAMSVGEFERGVAVEKSLQRRIRDCMAQRCVEPGLDAATVAAALSLPEPLLHQHLAAECTTFAAALLELRFALALRQMQLPAFGHLGLEALARQSGFAQPRQFMRMLARRKSLRPSGSGGPGAPA